MPKFFRHNALLGASLIFSLFCASAPLRADQLSSATALIDAGDLSAAKDSLNLFLELNPSPKQQAPALVLLGEIELAGDNYSDARALFQKAKDAGNVDANLFLARMAALDYNFPEAKRLYNAFNSAKAKSPHAAGLAPDINRQISAAQSALQRVEKIIVLDTIRMPASTFFEAYRLPASMGSIRDAAMASTPSGKKEAETVFVNESNDLRLWAQTDTTGYRNITEALLLTDGSWSHEFLPPVLADGGNADYPFLMPDGTTLYYASDGDSSMGGYDIFVASRDAASGEWLLPQNLGMPYNSPANDFMLAIDEENGFGWWASDREMILDMVTIYVYMLNDLRRNIDPEHESLLSFARIDHPEITVPTAEQLAEEAAAYSNDDDDDEDDDDGDDESLSSPTASNVPDIDDARRRLRQMRAQTPDYRTPDFLLPMPGGRKYQFFTDFRSRQSASLMKKYLDASRNIDAEAASLDAMRREYARSRSKALGNRIADAERRLLSLREDAGRQLSQIYRLELNNR